MPANLTPEFHEKFMAYKRAKNLEEKIKALKELIAVTPKHKGTEKLLANLKKTLARLEEASLRRKKAGGGRKGIKKVAPLVVIVGPPNSGKTTLFKLLTGKGEPKPWPYSTTEADTAVTRIKGAKIQFIDCPSFDFGYAANADVVLLTVADEELLRKFSGRKVVVWNRKPVERLKEELWEALDLIRVYTPGAEEPMLLKRGSRVRDAVEKIHSSMLKTFKFARIRRNGKTFKVGLDFELKDGDFLEIRA